MSDLPLSRYTVLDLTIARAGPTCVRLLADWGANIIRVEPPPKNPDMNSITGDRHGPDSQNLHRNKRGLTIDLKHPKGKALFMDLARKSDVIVENFRADVKNRLGIDYESVKAVNPAIIYASISGFGQDGPYWERPGVDQILQGMSGLMSITGEPGQGPMRAGIAISDTTAGMFLGQGILLALIHREHTGEGQWVHTSLLEAMLSKLDFQGARYTMKGEVPEQQGNFHPTLSGMGTFESADGLVNLAASSNKMFANFCEVLQASHLLENPDFQGTRARAKNRAAVNAAINEVTKQFPTAELVEKLNPVGVPCGPVNTIGEAFEDEHVKYLKMTKTAEHKTLGNFSLIRSPINLSRFPHTERFHHPGPDAGEHNAEILKEFGYEDAEVENMKAEGII